VNKDVSKSQLVAKAKVIVTVRGTIGIEAAMQGKRVITLGRHISENLDGVTVADGIENLQILIKMICKGQDQGDFCSLTRSKFINTLINFQNQGTFHSTKNAQKYKESDYIALADAIKKLQNN
jgi:hypothetical protein